MNRLKHILGVNVPRHVPSAKRSYGVDVNNSVQFRQGNTRLVSKGSKTICKRRSKTKSSVMSLKKSSLESVARGARHYSTHQNVKFNGNGTNKRRVLQTMINNANRNSSFIASVEMQQQPRSYAEMIADYSEAIRKVSAATVRNDNSCFSNTVRKSPFSTLISPYLSKRIINIAKRSEVSRKGQEKGSCFSDPFNPFNQSIRNDSTDIVEATNKDYVQVTSTESKSEDRSYVKLVADCSKSGHSISAASNSALTPRLNVLARSSLESFATPTRNASSTNNSQGIRRKASRVVTETPRQNLTQVSTNAGASKQPQIELHMVPSAKESVVSINVDSVSTRLSSPLKFVSDELSVVVRSNQKTAASRSTSQAQWNAATIRQGASSASRHRADFGPMHISISEDSAPIKQIEFSINGKPVSELKSIVARTERLDVMTSSDEIEIRVPFAKDERASAASRSRAEDELRRRSDSSVEQILNVQISANFQNDPAKGSAERPHNVATMSTKSTPSPPQAPATQSSLKDSAKVSSAVFDNDDAQRRGTSARKGIKADDTIKRKINKRRVSSEDQSSKAQRETTRKLSADKSAMDDNLTIEKAKNAEAGKLCAKKITIPPRYSEANKYDKNEPSDDTRVPTNMIPWWSSSDDFNKIRKQEDNHKPSDWNEKKLSNAPTILAQSTNNAPNNFSDMISPWNPLRQYEELKPTIQHSSLFRLKPSRENPDTISKVTENESKVKTMQTPVTEKDNEKISSIKQTEPVTLSTLETTNVQSKHEANGELDTHVKETSVLPRKPKASKDTQDSPLKQGREKKSNYLLGETHSINEAFRTKAEINDILGDIRPLEKRKDGSLIDYGLRMSSRKSTIKLNSEVKGIRKHPSPTVMKAQDLISKKSIIEIMPKTEQINKAETLKRIEWDKAEKSEAKRIILKENDESIMKNLLALADAKTQDQNLIKNIKGSKDRPKNLSSASKITDTQKSGKLKNFKSSELNDTQQSFKRLMVNQMIQRKKWPLVAIDTTKSASQTKPNLTSKIKNHNPLIDSIEKNPEATLFTRQPANKLAKITRNATIETAKRSSASGDLLSKKRQENQSKLAQDIRNTAGSTDHPKKPNGSAGFKSADSKMRSMRSEVKFSESHVNFNRSQPTIIGNVSPWAHIDRPEKSVLYSAWLQRFQNDVDNHEKLF